MKKRNKAFSLNALDFRIFITLYELEKDNLYAKSNGITKILKGENDFTHISTFKTLKNISSKKLSLRMKILLRKGYLALKFFNDNEELYYCLKELGRKETITYLSKHKKPFKKFEEKEDDLIVKIF